MKHLRWQILIVVLALGAIILLLLGQQPEKLPGLAIQATEQPSQGGVYVEALIGEPGRLNPVLDWYNSVDRDVDRLIYSSLVKFDERSSPYGDLADSWGISQDGKIYNFLIRPATWHDGQAVTSEDVVFTVGLLRNDEIPLPDDLKLFWQKVEVEPLAENVVQFKIPEAFAPFLDYLTFGILPKHIWEGLTIEEIIGSSRNLTPIGSGPYRFSRFLTENGGITGVELSANQDYFKEKAYIEKIVFQYFPNAEDAFAMFQRQHTDETIAEGGDDPEPEDKIMGISTVPDDLLEGALKTQQLNLYTGITPRLNILLFNLGNEQAKGLQDLEVRKALYQGMNRQQIYDKVLSGQAIQATGPIFPNSWAYYSGLTPQEFDQRQAVETLKAAGYVLPAEGGNIRAKDDVRLEFELLHLESSPYLEIAQLIQSAWGRIGVSVTLKSVSQADMNVFLSQHTYQMALVEINNTRFPDPDPYPFWHQSQITRGQNYSQWNDRQASEFIEQGRTQVEPVERTRLYQNFQLRFMQEIPSLPLFYPVSRYLVSPEVQGVRIGPLFEMADRFNYITSWYLKTE